MVLQWHIRVVVHSSKAPEGTTSRVNPDVNHALWVIMVDCWRFGNCLANVLPWVRILVGWGAGRL